jgi:hypothetical protein
MLQVVHRADAGGQANAAGSPSPHRRFTLSEVEGLVLSEAEGASDVRSRGIKFPIVISGILYAVVGALLSIVTASPIQAQSYSVDATGLPILDSLPSARGVAYIDFNGGTVFGEVRGAYDLDGDDATFNAAEQEDIYNAWLDVSAHFAMFDINVTTVAPNKHTTPTAHQLVTPDFSNAAANVGVFGNTSSVARGAAQSSYARSRSTAITHEFGHIFGLYHQSEYDSEGNLTREYRRVDPVTNIAPIMGVDYQGKFSSWQDGFTGTNMNPQDDIAILTNTLISTYNSFPGGSYTGDGFRPDEHGNTQGTATTLALNYAGGSATASAQGVIERHTDTDMFSFNWNGGDLTMTAESVRNVAASPDYASSLGMDLALYNSQGQLVAQDLSGVAADVDATVSVTGLVAGTYYFAVDSAGAYDDLGAYTLDFNGTPVVAAPARLTVDQRTGEIILVNPSSNIAAFDLEAISITSASGALDPLQWTSIAGNYDGSGDGSVDDDDWAVLTASFSELTEAADTGGEDGSLAIGTEISLGNAWIGALVKDLSATYTDLDGDVFALEIFYEGSDNILGDLNTDGSIDASDYLILIANAQADMSGLNAPQAYRLGDLDGDLNNDIADFALFRAAFEAQSLEPGAFAAMVQSVPEPGSLAVLLSGACLFYRRRRA